MAYGNTSEAIEALAYQIAENVYLDVAKWHLYLGDAKLHIPLAERLYPLLDENRLSESAVNEVLQTMRIPIGGGRQQLAIASLIPNSCQADLMKLLEDYQDQL
ncbi:thylakoid-associated protein [filamentous cyanobacterium CCP5]|nr:thylakoid-associated protein [filamentous cyanobacterium CCP5]